MPIFCSRSFIGFHTGSDGKEPAYNAGDLVQSLGREDPGKDRDFLGRKWQVTPVFLPGEFHRQGNLAGCGP